MTFVLLNKHERLIAIYPYSICLRPMKGSFHRSTHKLQRDVCLFRFRIYKHWTLVFLLFFIVPFAFSICRFIFYLFFRFQSNMGLFFIRPYFTRCWSLFPSEGLSMMRSLVCICFFFFQE